MKSLAGLLHISRKAGKLLLGRTAVAGRAKSGREIFVFVADDAGKTAMRKFEGIATERLKINSSELGEIFDRERLSIIGVTDKGLASEIREMSAREIHKPVGTANPV